MSVPGLADAEPFCPHYGTCGGCQLQHVSDETARGRKIERLQHALSARGVPVLAHPSWLDRSEGIYQICDRLKFEGLAGVEVHYSTHRPEQTAQYLEIARHLDLLVTGGSDFHGITKPDIEVGIGRGNLQVPSKLLEPLRKAATS